MAEIIPVYEGYAPESISGSYNSATQTVTLTWTETEDAVEYHDYGSPVYAVYLGETEVYRGTGTSCTYDASGATTSELTFKVYGVDDDDELTEDYVSCTVEVEVVTTTWEAVRANGMVELTIHSNKHCSAGSTTTVILDDLPEAFIPSNVYTCSIIPGGVTSDGVQ